MHQALIMEGKFNWQFVNIKNG